MTDACPAAEGAVEIAGHIAAENQDPQASHWATENHAELATAPGNPPGAEPPAPDAADAPPELTSADTVPPPAVVPAERVLPDTDHLGPLRQAVLDTLLDAD